MHTPCLPLCPAFSVSSAHARTAQAAEFWSSYSLFESVVLLISSLPATLYRTLASLIYTYIYIYILNFAGFSCRFQGSATFVRFFCRSDISPPVTWYQPLCSTSIIAVRANVVDGASRCWKGRIRGRSDWSVGNQRREAGRRRERVEMRFLRHSSAAGLRFVDENPKRGSG